MMVSGPNLNETSIVSGGYGGSGDGLIPTGMNDQNRTEQSGEGERNGSGDHRIYLRKLELCPDILGTSASMNPLESSQPKAGSQGCSAIPTCHLALEMCPFVFSLLPPPESS